jgi:hypothetical protein
MYICDVFAQVARWTIMTNERACGCAYLSRQSPAWHCHSSFTNISKLHDDAILRAAPPDPPIGPSPLLKFAIHIRVLKMASKKVTTAFSVRTTASIATPSPPTPLRRSTPRLCRQPTDGIYRNTQFSPLVSMRRSTGSSLSTPSARPVSP